MARPTRIALVAAALAGLGGGVTAGCGGGSDGAGRIPSTRASELTDRLDAVAAAVAAGDCDAASQAVVQVQGDVVELPASVDAALRERLQEGVANLRERVPVACGATPDEGAEPAPEETEEQPPADTGETDGTPTDTDTQETEPPATDPGETEPPATDPTPTEPAPPATTGETAPDTGGATPEEGATTP